MENFDFVIVGAGAAGSLLAQRLADGGKNTVCVLEGGPLDTNRWIRIPAGFTRTIFDPDWTYQYQSEPISGTGQRRVPLIQGRTVGGGTSVNGMLIVRGQRQDYDAWAARGNTGWSYAEVLPYFKRFEHRIDEHGTWIGDEKFRGHWGSLPVADVRFTDTLCDAFVEAAVACGLPRNPDYNGETQFGVGRFQSVIERGRRVTAADAFLHSEVKAGRVVLRTRALVKQILFEGMKATGVEYYDAGGQSRSVAARRGVVLCAGTFNSAKLLQLSGVGPAVLLQQHGIALRRALPVGENLRDHYSVRYVYRTRNARSLNSYRAGLPLLGQILRYYLGMESLIGIPPGLCYGFAKTDSTLPEADLQLSFAPASLKAGTAGLLDDFPGMTCGVWKHRTDSVGYVRIASGDVRDAPIINPNYLDDERDVKTLIGGMRFMARLFATDPIARYVESNTLPGPGVEKDDELLDYAHRIGGSTYHPTGSCRMGPASDPSTVVGPDLRVHGMEGLYVADGSIMPAEPSANTYAPILMIAEKASDMILGKPALPAVLL